MTKDPAFLFYSSDFITGTLTMTDEEIGMYVRILCMQHQTCHLDAKTMQKLCGGIIPPAVLAKFSIDAEGSYYNQRLEDEMIKRKEKSKKNKKNATMRWDSVRSANAVPFINENVNETESTIIPTKEEKGGTGEKTQDTTTPPADPLANYNPAIQSRVAENIFELTRYLNSKTGGSLKADHPEYCSIIWQRLQDGYSLEQLRLIIDTMVPIWLGDPKTRMWLTPTTLFRAEKIDEYLNAARPLVTSDVPAPTPHKIKFDQP